MPPANDWHDVTVTAPGPGHGLGATVTIDGVPVKGVIGYKVKVGTVEANEVTITFYAKSINKETPSGTNQEAVPGAPEG